MSSSSRSVSLILTPNGMQTRRINKKNGRIVLDKISVSPRSVNHSSARSFSTPSSARSFFMPSSAGSFFMPSSAFLMPSLMSSAISNMEPLFSNCASPASPYSMSRVFQKPTKAMKSEAQVQAAISQLSSSTSPESIKQAQNHLALALKNKTKSKRKSKTSKTGRFS